MDKIKEFFQSGKPAEEAQTDDKPGMGHQRVDSTQTPADTKSPDEAAQPSEDKAVDQPSGETAQGVQDTGPTETQTEPPQASTEQPSQDDAQNNASEIPPPLDSQGEGEQKDTVAPDQEHGDPTMLRENDPAAQDTQAEPDVSKPSAVEPDQEPSGQGLSEEKAQESIGEEKPLAAAGDEQPQTSVAEGGASEALQGDSVNTATAGTALGETKEAGHHEIQPDILEASQEGKPSIDDAQNKAAENVPDVGQPGDQAETGQTTGDNDAVRGGGVALGDSKPDEPSGQGLSEEKPQESIGEEKPLAAAGDEQPQSSVTEASPSEGLQGDSANTDAAETGLTETKEAGHHEIQPEILEASQEGKPSIDDAQSKAAENTPDVGESADQAPTGGASESRDEGVTDAPGDVEQPSEAKDDSGPAAAGIAGGSLAASEGQDTLGDKVTSTDKLENDLPQQDEQLPSTGGTEAQDAGLSQPEPGQSDVPESSQPAGDLAGDKGQENAPDVQAEGQQPLTSEPQSLSTADEPKEALGQSQPEASGVSAGESQLDTSGGDSKPADVPAAQQESLVDAGGPPQSTERDESAPIDEPKETPGTEGVAADQEENDDEEGEDAEGGKKSKLTERLKEKVKKVVNKD